MKAALYARVSDVKQVKQQTIAGQLHDLRAYAAREGWEVVAEYTDDAVSGTVEFIDRPAARRLIEDAERGRFQVVLAVNIDRLGRGDKFSGMRARWLLRDLGLRTVLIDQQHISDDDTGDLVGSVESYVSQQELKKLVTRTKRGMERGAREGRYLGGQVPFGFTIDADGHYLPDESPLPGCAYTPVEIVQMIFRWVVEDGRSCRWSARELTAMQVPTPAVRAGRTDTHGIWHASRVRNILRDSLYAGEHVWGKVNRGKFQRDDALRPERITRAVPALIDPDTWQAAQAALSANARFSVRNAHHEYLLRGLIKCSRCGQTFIGGHYQTKTMGTRVYYRCNGVCNPGDGIRCTAERVDADLLEAELWGDVAAWLHDPGNVLEEIAQRYVERQGAVADVQARIATLQRELDGLAGQEDKLLDLFMGGTIGKATLEMRISKLTAQADALRVRIEAEEREWEDALAGQADLTSVATLLDELRRKAECADFATKQRVLQTLVESIYAEPDGSVRVVYKFAVATSTGRHRAHPSR